MSDERAMILKMLSEGKITVEEADALIDVLNESEEDGEPAGFSSVESRAGSSGTTGSSPGPRRQDHDSHRDGPGAGRGGHGDERTRNQRHRGGSKAEGFKFDIDLSGIGETVRDAMSGVKEAMKGVSETIQDAFEGVDFSDIDFRHGVFRAMGKIRAEDEQTVQTSLDGATELAIVSKWGDVRVTGTQTDSLTVVARIVAWAGTKEEAQEKVKQVQINFRREEDKWLVECERCGNQGIRVDYELTVPESLSASVSTVSGDLWLEDLKGSQTVRTISGDISVANLGSDMADVQTIQTQSGDVAAAALAGSINLSSASGDIHINGFAGSLAAGTQSGDVEVQDANGSVELKTMSGDVSAQIIKLGHTDNTASSVSGDVSVTLPADAAVDVSAQSTSGDVDVSLELENKEKTKNKITGTANGGGVKFSVVSVSGDVEIQ